MPSAMAEASFDLNGSSAQHWLHRACAAPESSDAWSSTMYTCRRQHAAVGLTQLLARTSDAVVVLTSNPVRVLAGVHRGFRGALPPSRRAGPAAPPRGLRPCSRGRPSVALGGEIGDGLGWFVPVTLVDNPTEDCRFVVEEPSAPFLLPSTWRDGEDSIQRQRHPRTASAPPSG